MYTSTNEYDIYYEIRSHVSYEDYYKGNNYYSDPKFDSCNFFIPISPLF